MKNSYLELYTDYLLSTFGAATATKLSAMVDGHDSHDRITRFFLAQGRVDHLLDRAQWMVRGHEFVQVTHREKTLCEGICATHGQRGRVDCLDYLGKGEGCH